MSTPIRPHRRLALLAPLAALAMVAAGCGGGTKSATKTPISLAADPASASAIVAGTVINFGDQQQFLETLLGTSGGLAGASYKVNFIEFDSGPLVDAGFAAGRIDVGVHG